MKYPRVNASFRRAAGLVRKTKRRLNRRLRPGALPAKKPPKPPQLSVIVAVHNGARYLDECLTSVLSSSLRRLEVIAVDEGSTDGSLAILTKIAAHDRRVRVIRRPYNGVAAARNAGVRESRAPYLTFVNQHDTVPPLALATMVRSLQRSGSDFAVGAVQRVRNGRRTRPAWVVNVHQFDQVATTIDEFPIAMQDMVVFNKVFRKSFWEDAVGPFPEISEHGDLLNTLTAYIRAKSFDILKTITYQWHRRADHASIVQERYDRKMLDDRIPVLKAAWEIVAAESSQTVAGAWLGGVLDDDLGTYPEHANLADDAFRDGLQAAAAYFISIAGPQAWEHVRVDRRVRLWLAARGRWSTLEQIIEFFRLNGAIPKTHVSEGRVTADLPFRDDLGDDIPEVCLELAGSQTALAACIERAFWNDSGQLEIQGWAYIRGIDLSDRTPELAAFLVESETGAQLPLPVQPQCLTAATRWGNVAFQKFDPAGFRIIVDVSALPPIDPIGGSRKWVLHIRNRTCGIERSGPVRSVIRSGIGLRMRARELHSADDPGRIVPVMDSNLGFAIQLRPDRLRAEGLTTGPGGHVGGRLRTLRPVAAPLVAVRAISIDAQVESQLLPDGDGSFRFDLVLPVGGGKTVRWEFRAVDENGRRYRVSWSAEHVAGRRIVGPSERVTWLRSPRGYCDLVSDRVGLQATSVSVSEENVEVEVEAAGLERADLARARLRSSLATVPVSEVVRLSQDRYRLRFPTTTRIWNAAGLPLPTGTYSIVVEPASWLPADTVPLECGVTESLLEECPAEGRTEWHGFTIARSAGRDRLVLTFRAPLTDTERGRFAQRRLSDWYAETEFQPREAVLFQCYRGEFSTDSQRAIHEELWRRKSRLTLLWAVSHLSVALPEGAVPLLIGSQAWYEAVGSVRYLCQNIDYDRFFRKRPYQKYLQTFHGYPWKSMGVSLWRAQGRSEALIQAECDRRNAAWDSILVPAEFCEEMYRREYRYPHEVLVTGYPRDDALVTADAAAVRSAVLSRLGIPPTKKVVLYAPTWRDTVATGAWTAQLFDELDLDQLTEELGEGFALLLRGHNYNLREGSVETSASVLDVSSYPEINDLILAADVAILDYSSLRFDWMLTGKPVLFFVPDLANYLSARTVLFEYGPTAPGPMLTTTDEVIRALRDLRNVAAEYAAARETFNLEFQGLHDGHATTRVVDRFFGADSWP